jgi:PAS domain-containing protein
VDSLIEGQRIRPPGLCRKVGIAGIRKLRTRVSNVPQKPLELILARNLISALSTPAFLVDEGGLLVFYNEAAGALLGKGFEEVGQVGPTEWGSLFGPYDGAGEAIPYEELPIVQAVRDGRPAHSGFGIRTFDGQVHAVECSAFPILTAHGSRGGVALFWPAEEDFPTAALGAAAGAAASNGAARRNGATA